MGDMSKEPSMEEILSSIKRIIAEEGDEASRGITARTLRRGRAAEDEAQAVELEQYSSANGAAVPPHAQSEEVLELTDALDLVSIEESAQPDPVPSPEPEASVMAQTARKPSSTAAEPPRESAPVDTMLSVESEVAARHSLSALSAMVVKPQGGDDNTLESLVRKLLRPMMKDWLDANLPDLVEAMVAKEIARITGREL